jgi:ribonuclease HI
MKIYVDGSGKGRYGFVTEGNIAKIFEKKNITNNQAEYLAILEALKWVEEKELTILSDSFDVVNQLNHEFHIKDDKLRELALQVWETMKRKGLTIEFKWIPRNENKAGKMLG